MGATPSTIRRIARLYIAAVGYDPFLDDPTATPQDVLLILRQWRKASRQDENTLPIGKDPRS